MAEGMDLNWAQEMQAQMQQMARMGIVWTVLGCVCVMLAALALVLLLRMRARNRRVEQWLHQELTTLQTRHDLLEGMLKTAAKPPYAHHRKAQLAARQSYTEQSRAPETQPRREPLDLLATLNEILAGNQPYNLIEAVRAIEPRLHLQRLTPMDAADRFADEILLEPGGDGLFASIEGDTARLFPNYSRFSATLDPKPFYEGARHGGRIHSVLAPALLRRREDGTWLLLQRGRVQMRQGK